MIVELNNVIKNLKNKGPDLTIKELEALYPGLRELSYPSIRNQILSFKIEDTVYIIKNGVPSIEPAEECYLCRGLGGFETEIGPEPCDCCHGSGYTNIIKDNEFLF